MYRDLITMSVKVFISSKGLRYGILFTLLMVLHETLYLNTNIVWLYITLTLLFLLSAVYADKKLFNQVVEALTISGARTRILRLSLCVCTSMEALLVAIPQALIFISRSIVLDAITILISSSLVLSIILGELSMRVRVW